MRRSKAMWITVIVATVLLGVWPDRWAAASGPEAKFRWKYQDQVSATDAMGVAGKYFCTEVGRRTDGRLIIDHYPNRGLGIPNPGIIKALKDKLLESSFVYPAACVGEVPFANIMDLPGLLPDDMKVQKRVAKALFPYYQKAFLEKGVLVLGMSVDLGRTIYTKKVIRSMADLKGKTIRSVGPSEEVFLRALGATPVTIDMGEVATAVERGTVDGFTMTHGSVKAMKFYEFAKYCYELRTGTLLLLGVSKPAFDGLPADLQKIVVDVGGEAYERLWDLSENGHIEARKWLAKEGGMVFVTPSSDARKAVEKAGQEYAAAWLSKVGPPGPEMMKVLRKTASP